MRPDSEFRAAQELIASGLNDCQISRATGIPRPTIRDWRTGRGRHGPPRRSGCPICEEHPLDPANYAYLLGLYLGDGCISAMPRGVFKLRIALDSRYPGIIEECRQAMRRIRLYGRPAGSIQNVGCVEVYAYWKHWPCVFPQHGPGPKHLRPIQLADWQEEIVAAHPDRLLRGLIHSDGCRVLNRVNGKGYPRYHFTNNSQDIRDIFGRACDKYGVRWRQNNWKSLSIARAPDVAKLDLVVGPKA
jgi:hypothetical protein